MSQNNQWNDFPLPDGRTVRVSNDPADWPKIGETSFVPYDAVLPDPNQPRDTTNYTESDEHALLSASTSQRAQGLIIRVRPFSLGDLEDHKDSHPRAQYWIVDGERRYHASGPKGANLGVLEITVHPYSDKKAVFLDQVVLNTLQLGLNTPELVRALAKIRSDYNVQSANALSKMVNMTQVKVSKLWHMINLAPDLLELTNEQKFSKHHRGARLTVGPASELAQIMEANGKTAHERQREIYQDALRRSIKGAVQQAVFFMQFQEKDRQDNRQRRRPKRQRNRIRTLVELISENDLLSASNDELGAALGTATPDELLKLSSDLSAASTKLRTFSGKVTDRIGGLLETIKTSPTVRTTQAQPPKKETSTVATPAGRTEGVQRNTPEAEKARRPSPLPPASKSPTSDAHVAPQQVRQAPQVQETLPRRSEQLKPVPRAVQSTSTRPSLSRDELRRWSSVGPAKEKAPEQRDKPTMADMEKFAELRELFRSGLNANAWHTVTLRISLMTITDPDEYLKIHKEGRFRFQKEGTERPSHYPDPEDVRKFVEASS